MEQVRTAERVAIESRRVERVYGVLARVYDGFFDWALGPGRRHAVERLGGDPGDEILEIGVGTGLSLPLYPPKSHVTGIDISEAMLERAISRMEDLGRSDVVLRKMDARELAFEDGTFDRVLAPYVISVVPEPEKVLSEMHRVCKPGGKVVVVNHFWSDNPILHFGEKLLTPASQWLGFRLDLPIDVVLRHPGFRVERIEKVNLFGLWRLVELRRSD